ncbi:hypothetical protein BJP36_36420 [Moorena producens JHB]|uniref:Uncharacterized protein n=1 Tax=Moorena producens (strain JHB) TaxID=1454205 RepID=A0A9Q9UW71_MOOP1|nr:hypothetical protein [Moorena producens]WAN69576.1 hypothetical protein BJP36_36420 [Moorena producens JHB]
MSRISYQPLALGQPKGTVYALPPSVEACATHATVRAAPQVAQSVLLGAGGAHLEVRP